MSLRVFFDSPIIKDLAETMEITQQKITDNKPDKKENVFSKIIKGQI